MISFDHGVEDRLLRLFLVGGLDDNRRAPVSGRAEGTVGRSRTLRSILSGHSCPRWRSLPKRQRGCGRERHRRRRQPIAPISCAEIGSVIMATRAAMKNRPRYFRAPVFVRSICLELLAAASATTSWRSVNWRRPTHYFTTQRTRSTKRQCPRPLSSARQPRKCAACRWFAIFTILG